MSLSNALSGNMVDETRHANLQLLSDVHRVLNELHVCPGLAPRDRAQRQNIFFSPVRFECAYVLSHYGNYFLSADAEIKSVNPLIGAASVVLEMLLDLVCNHFGVERTAVYYFGSPHINCSSILRIM